MFSVRVTLSPHSELVAGFGWKKKIEPRDSTFADSHVKDKAITHPSLYALAIWSLENLQKMNTANGGKEGEEI